MTTDDRYLSQRDCVLADCESLRQSYSELPIGSSAHKRTHPDALASIAILHGLRPAPVTNCRFLELGCACGGNLVPLACSLPDSRFVGVDISEVQIQMARNRAGRLGLGNLELRAENLLDLNETIGEFDYILCAGVFSWVPPMVQEHILHLFARCLAPQGIAYLSFNAYPGWHVRGIVRDLLRIHTCDLPDVATKTSAARRILAHLEESAEMDNSPLTLLRHELSTLRKSRDSYLYHEHLVDHNTAFHFGDVVKRASASGLKYLSDVPMLDADLAERAIGIISDSPSQVQLQQAADFLEVRQYHDSLFCRTDRSISPPSADRLHDLLIGSDFRPTAAHPDVATSKPEEFTGPQRNLVTEHPFVKAALVVLSGCQPAAMPYAELWQQVCQLLMTAAEPFPLEEDVDEPLFADAMLYCCQRSIVGLRTYQPNLEITVPEKPLVSQLARLQSKTDESVASLLHTTLKLTPLQRRMLPFLDGSRDRHSILTAMNADADSRSDNSETPGIQEIEEALAQLAACGMLLRGDGTSQPFDREA